MNKKISKYVMSVIVAVVAIYFVFGMVTTNAVAYESSDDYQHNHYTAHYKGGPQICGLHICQPGKLLTP